MSAKKPLVPKSSKFIYAVLEYASERKGEFHRSEAMKWMVKHFELTPAAQREKTKGGHALRYENRTSRAISNLTNHKDLLRRKRPGFYEITARGRKELALSNGEITLAYLREKYPE